MQTFLIIAGVVILAAAVVGWMVRQFLREISGIRKEADEKDAELTRDIEQWRKGR